MNWYKKSKSKSNPISSIYVRLLLEGEKNQYQFSILGYVEKYPIYLMTPQKKNLSSKSVLVVSAFHGDEPSGVWGIINFLKNKYSQYKNAFNISFIPIVNPTGLAKNRRNNNHDEEPNRGYIHRNKTNDKITVEDAILKKNVDKLVQCAKDGLLNLHEDINKESFYMYSCEKSNKPTEKTYQLLALGESLFGLSQKRDIPTTPLETNVKGDIKETGLAFNDCDGTLDDLLFHKGVPFCVTTETPEQLPLKTRNNANMEFICKFLEVV